MKKSLLVLMTIVLTFVFVSAFAEEALNNDFSPLDFDYDQLSLEELETLETKVSAALEAKRLEYAKEHGNRKIEFESDSMVLFVGGKEKVVPSVVRVLEDAPEKTKLSWSSSDDKVAKVANGTVTGVGTGKAVITCFAADDNTVEASFEVEVKQAVKKLTTSEKSIAVKKKDKAQISYEIVPEDASDKEIRWESSDESIATVSAEGEITGILPGDCVITGTSVSNEKATISIPVHVESLIPLEIIKVTVREVWGTPRLYIAVKNNSQKDSILAFKYSVRCYDAFGNVLHAYDSEHGDTEANMIWDDDNNNPIKPGQTWDSLKKNYYWRLSAYDTAYSVEAWLTSIQTVDGDTINIPASEQVIVKAIKGK